MLETSIFLRTYLFSIFSFLSLSAPFNCLSSSSISFFVISFFCMSFRLAAFTVLWDCNGALSSSSPSVIRPRFSLYLSHFPKNCSSSCNLA